MKSNHQVSFVSNGVIDPRCITTIGVSVKETDNPIGFFGTGLKYAIAIILRSGGTITIYAGMDKYEFSKKVVEIRGKEMNIVCMNGNELGFTTDLGKHWKMWQAMREIYCNTKDEGGSSHEGELLPQENSTTVVVDCEEFYHAFTQRNSYILDCAPLFQGKYADFQDRISSGIFYKTILVADNFGTKPFLFTPNITCSIDLTEDRTAKDHWQICFAIARSILLSTDKSFLKRWLTASREYLEHEMDIDYSSIEPSAEFIEVVGNLAPDTSRPINRTALTVYARHQPEPLPIECELMDSEKTALSSAIEFCCELKYPVNEYKIVTVESLGKGILGRAEREKEYILLSRRAIQMGNLTCAATLIEEWAHIKHGYDDCQRDMQNWLFEQVTRLGSAYISERLKH